MFPFFLFSLLVKVYGEVSEVKKSMPIGGFIWRYAGKGVSLRRIYTMNNTNFVAI